MIVQKKKHSNLQLVIVVTLGQSMSYNTIIMIISYDILYDTMYYSHGGHSSINIIHIVNTNMRILISHIH